MKAHDLQQPDLFDRLPFPEKFTRTGTSIVPPQRDEIVRARTADPQTSKDAAARVPQFESGHYWLILCALRDIGPMTVSELALATKLQEQQINKRLPELQRLGKAETATKASGEALTRPGASGARQRVWRAV